MTPDKDAERVESALTPEEWAEFLDPANGGWARLVFHNHSDHAAAAVGLYGQPFGFTEADREDVLSAVRLSESRGSHPMAASLRSLAARIAALLPPEKQEP